jgi:hypothetical protein
LDVNALGHKFIVGSMKFAQSGYHPEHGSRGRAAAA